LLVVFEGHVLDRHVLDDGEHVLPEVAQVRVRAALALDVVGELHGELTADPLVREVSERRPAAGALLLLGLHAIEVKFTGARGRAALSRLAISSAVNSCWRALIESFDASAVSFAIVAGLPRFAASAVMYRLAARSSAAEVRIAQPPPRTDRPCAVRRPRESVARGTITRRPGRSSATSSTCPPTSSSKVAMSLSSSIVAPTSPSSSPPTSSRSLSRCPGGAVPSSGSRPTPDPLGVRSIPVRGNPG
jgi:hypothetical protein